jgi:hypothetical protein
MASLQKQLIQADPNLDPDPQSRFASLLEALKGNLLFTSHQSLFNSWTANSGCPNTIPSDNVSNSSPSSLNFDLLQNPSASITKSGYITPPAIATLNSLTGSPHNFTTSVFSCPATTNSSTSGSNSSSDVEILLSTFSITAVVVRTKPLSNITKHNLRPALNKLLNLLCDLEAAYNLVNKTRGLLLIILPNSSCGFMMGASSHLHLLSRISLNFEGYGGPGGLPYNSVGIQRNNLCQWQLIGMSG